MQELRLVAVSEDGTYAVLAVPGRGGRFSLPIDDRLRTVARGQFSRLAQYEIEVENPLRPKEIQDRIRAGETAEEIADAAGIPVERVRRFEGPVLAEREYRAQEAQRATVRGHTESGPGPRLGDVVLERLSEIGAPAESLTWDSRKRADGSWQVQLQFAMGSRPQVAEWLFDPRRRQVVPADDLASRLCLPQSDWPATADKNLGGTATVTPIGSRQSPSPFQQPRFEPTPRHEPPPRHEPAPQRAEPRLEPARRPEPAHRAEPARPEPARRPEPTRRGEPEQRPEPIQAEPDWVAAGSRPMRTEPGRPEQARPEQARPEPAPEAEPEPAAEQQPEPAAEPAPAAPARPARKARGRRSSVPSWDEIMLGNSRGND
jgi:hypothetical protein